MHAAPGPAPRVHPKGHGPGKHVQISFRHRWVRMEIHARGRRQGPQPLDPGAGPAPVSSPEAFGGNRSIRLPPLPPTTSCRPRADSGSPAPEPCPVIYSVFCVWCSKTIVFYRVLWPSPSPGFTLATLKNNGFFMVLGLWKGSGTENWTS